MKIEDIQLKNTVNMMISDDYQDRFRAEEEILGSIDRGKKS